MPISDKHLEFLHVSREYGMSRGIFKKTFFYITTPPLTACCPPNYFA